MQDNNQSLAPIALFVYNRKDHAEKTVEALRKNTLANQSDLFVFSDGAKDAAGNRKVQEVRDYLKTVRGFKSVTIKESEKNVGLANSIISGVTEIVDKFGKIIVVEDDLVTSPYFLSYMNQGLVLYENEEKVASIHGYVYPVKTKLPPTFFIKGADCWGWATWKRAWDIFEPDGQKLLNEITAKNLEKEFDFDNSYNYTGMLKGQIAGQNNSWAVRWYASAFLNNKLTLYPGQSLVNNIGTDGSGTHFNKKNEDSLYETNLNQGDIALHRIPIEESAVGRKAFIKYFRSIQANILRRTWSKRPSTRVHLKKIKWLRKAVLQSRILWDYIFGQKGGPLDKKEPWIVAGAINWLETYLQKDMRTFEWGSGGSTLFTAERVKEITSIEHNYAWFLKTKMYLKRNDVSNCEYQLIESENISNPSYTSTDKKYLKHNFEKYCKAIDSFPNDYFDLVFIDGRARPSCIKHAIPKVKTGGYILLDNSEREEYQSAISTLADFKRTDFSENGSTTSIFQKI